MRPCAAPSCTTNSAVKSNAWLENDTNSDRMVSRSSAFSSSFAAAEKLMSPGASDGREGGSTEVGGTDGDGAGSGGGADAGVWTAGVSGRGMSSVSSSRTSLGCGSTRGAWTMRIVVSTARCVGVGCADSTTIFDESSPQPSSTAASSALDGATLMIPRRSWAGAASGWAGTASSAAITGAAGTLLATRGSASTG